MSALSTRQSYVGALLYNGPEWMKHSFFEYRLLKHLRGSIPAAPGYQVRAEGTISGHNAQSCRGTPQRHRFGISKSRATVDVATERVEG